MKELKYFFECYFNQSCSRVLLLFLIFILSWHTKNSAGLVEGSLIATINGPVPIQELKLGDRVISYSTDGSLIQAAITKVLQHRTDLLFCMYLTPCRFIIASPHQPFYDIKNGFIEAQYITNQNFITSIFPNAFHIYDTANIYVSPKNTFMHFDVYSIEIEAPHTYFVSDSSFNNNDKEVQHTFLLTHNGLPALGVGFSVIFDKTLASVSFGQAALSAGGLGLTAGPTGLIIGGMAGLGWIGYNLFFKKDKQKQNFVHIERTDRVFCGRSGPEGPQNPKNKEKEQITHPIADGNKRDSSLYKDITEPGSSPPNTQTDLTKNEFEKNLQDGGWEKTISKDGKVNIYKKDGAKYSVRNHSKSTDGPTAEYYAPNNGVATGKIRLMKG